MRLLLSGEGPTDLGISSPRTDGMAFHPGPMAHVIDKLLEPHVDYSMLDIHEAGGDCVRHVSEGELSEQARRLKPLLLPGAKSHKGFGVHTREAQVLGRLAKEDASERDDTAVAVLFRDTDGTRSAPRDLWQAKFESIQRGFGLAGFAGGVPMVPRPKSEAWLFCALKPDAYQHCAALEDAPGNDGSPNALKRRLAGLVGHVPTAAEQSDWVRSGRVDLARIDMPSYLAFKQALDNAARSALADRPA